MPDLKNLSNIVITSKTAGQNRKASTPSHVQARAKNKTGKVKKARSWSGLHFSRRPNLSKKVKLEELHVFAGQLATLLESGIPLLTGLAILADQNENPNFKLIIEKVRDDVNRGHTITQALSKYPKVFPTLFLAMIQAAEKSGQMADILKQLSIYLEQQDKLRKKVKAAIVYPRFVLFFFLFVLCAIIFGLVPKFKAMFESFGAQLPLPTEILLNISVFARDHLIYEIILVAALVISFKQFKKTRFGRYSLDRLELRIPLIGDLILKATLSKFCRTLSVLIRSGVSLVDSIQISSLMTPNVLFKEALQRVRRGVLEGDSIYSSLTQTMIFPAMLTKMIAVGEESGCLDKMLLKVSEIYDTHVDSRIAGLSSIIEPALMIALGAVALVVIICLYLPIFKIGSVIQ